MKRWFLLTPDGRVFEQPATFQKHPSTSKGDGLRLKELQHAVGGMIEHVQLDGRCEFWLNEEGKLLGLARNALATDIWTIFYGPTDMMVGRVLFAVWGPLTQKAKLVLHLIDLYLEAAHA